MAREYGVACEDAVVLPGSSNVMVHLRPAPVVARVMTGTAALHDDPEQWLARELAVGVFLAGRTDRVVAPTDLLPPGPHERDGLWMTLWSFVAHDPHAAPPGPAELGRALRELHEALAGFGGELAPLSGICDWLARLLGELRPSTVLTGADIDWLRRRLEELRPTVFESALPTQALHGDASASNLLRTGRGLVWNDFEDVCIGPVAWDVAGLMARDGEELLAAYGDPGVEDMAPFLQAHALYGVIWHASQARRRPAALRDAAAYLARLRAG
ncbi:phosphotransferase [Solirubrobacter soli]|uniref:phosphotransferase n=1 Tax=Solirubrobacter soli TaxID=363832 RepID=UPI00069E510B|nr:aminoglycoside phosphotransferase family protein [Solirubrobacter soli]